MYKLVQTKEEKIKKIREWQKKNDSHIKKIKKKYNKEYYWKNRDKALIRHKEYCNTPELSLNLNNGIPLCKEHHLEVHRLN